MPANSRLPCRSGCRSSPAQTEVIYRTNDGRPWGILMLITKLRSRECRELLTRTGFGRLACSCNDRPYIVPIYFCLDAIACTDFPLRDRKFCGCARTADMRGERRNPRPRRLAERRHSRALRGNLCGPDGAEAREHVRSLLKNAHAGGKAATRPRKFAGGRKAPSSFITAF